MNPDLISKLEQLIRRDPGQRGLLGQSTPGQSFGMGSLARAAAELAENAQRVVLVTGFYIPSGIVAASETDGPPGTVYLTKMLEQLGIKAQIVTDTHSESAVKSAARAVDLDPELVHIVPLKPEPEWHRHFYESGPGCGLTHLIAIERAGPGHTTETFQSQYPDLDINEFLSQVPPEKQGCCHNMRGLSIDEWNAPLHELFEQLPHFHPQALTMGIGDGGNEIGMGQLDWQQIQACLPLEGTSHIPCRVATDEIIVAGTSNWGALALTAAIAILKQRPDILAPWTAEHHLQLLERMVEKGPAVDGVTGRPEATVDGLPFLTYIQPWQMMRQLLEI
ncbi:hypothetical protein Pla110_04020 [Polystyrenella longa]|uniref:D-glutamate cyclase-like C-terminal domain-containing protein n=1 Tax=Polystyrenella longa TaxID=2528007 RepID=A0A518CHJ0_9PLAN|nr:glutamate cyclase domain-containing protein [Polystyrenella longa]QDU78698.1 hypothetical protein Pla110_04020 [Polystyrenella longa]